MWEIYEIGKQRNQILKNYDQYLDQILQGITEVLGDTEVFLFGSVLEGNLVGGSDVDILIIKETEKRQLDRINLIAEIEEKANLPLVHPFNFILLNSKEFTKWKELYQPRMKKLN